MLSSNELEEEVFFDSVDCLSHEGSVVGKGESGSVKLEYEIWMNEPLSIKERRVSFLREMGLDECSKDELAYGKSSEVMELDRFTERSTAVSSSSASIVTEAEENSDFYERETNSDSNSMIDDLDQDHLNDLDIDKITGLSPSAEEVEERRHPSHLEECTFTNVHKKKLKTWLKRFLHPKKEREDRCGSDVSKTNHDTPKMSRMKAEQNKKRYVELTGLYKGQEIKAHTGFILTMRFSPDGQYLASGGEDGVVRMWRVVSVDAVSGSFEVEFSSGKKMSNHASVVVPDKLFWIEETPFQEFHGHAGDVFDLAWSNSNCLLSCSMDRTVRLWQVGRDKCLNVFPHNDYVTCIQFNPVDERYFISGSIDGKVRIWGVPEKRVVNWADVRDVISAICYQPDGKGFIVGSITGTCRFYEASGSDLELDAEVHIRGRKKTSGNRITGIQFSLENPHRVTISSEDTKVRIFDGIEVVQKFKGLPKSGSQMSASFTSSGKHMVSVGEDSRVYVWNYNGLGIPSSKQTKSVRSCEHFLSEGVSVAVPWSGSGTDCMSHALTQDNSSLARESERFSIGSWFSMEGPCRGSATWPEEKLPLWDESIAEENGHNRLHHDNNIVRSSHISLSDAWGLVIVTAGWDGKIKTFHNYGLPVRL